MNNGIMVYVPLNNYENGVSAIARIEALKALAIKEKYSISPGDIAAVLGFDLPKEQGDTDARGDS